jgi:tRNA A-37 threonylcarbamoyl transferase component Bud32
MSGTSKILIQVAIGVIFTVSIGGLYRIGFFDLGLTSADKKARNLAADCRMYRADAERLKECAGAVLAAQEELHRNEAKTNKRVNKKS